MMTVLSRTLQCPGMERSQRRSTGQHEKTVPKRLAVVIMTNRTIKEIKKPFHLLLVVIRMSIVVIEIFAVASAEGVMQKPAQRISNAVEACSGVRDSVCLPRPW